MDMFLITLCFMKALPEAFSYKRIGHAPTAGTAPTGAEVNTGHWSL